MNKNLDKLKQFFRSNKTNSSQEKVYILNHENENDLRRETIEKRIKLLRDLGDIVMSHRLEEYAIQKLWSLTSDLIEPQNNFEARQAALIFYTKLIQGQYRDLSMMRMHFFRLIQNHNVPIDLPYCLQMFKALTDNGRDIQNFEEEIGIFMLKWIDQIIEGHLTAPYLELVVNIIKFNTAYIDREVIVGIVHRVCNDVCIQFMNDQATFLQCLFVIETVICYTVFPNEILAPCIIVLCRAVKTQAYLETSYRIMRNLLGTQLGYASLLTMTSMLNESRYYIDSQVLRGAVFHTNMNLWGGNNSSLQNGIKYSSTVLSSYLKALQSNHTIVTLEVIISIQTLLNKCGNDLSEPSWDIVVDILERIRENMMRDQIPSDLDLRFHNIIDRIEVLIDKNLLNADVNKIYNLIEKISNRRPESSVMKLISFRVSQISPVQLGWLEKLAHLMERFYRKEINQNVRISMIEHLKEIININRICYEDEILEKIVIVTFCDISQELDMKVRVAACKLLLDICSHCDTKRCLELFDILEKVINHPFDVYNLESKITKNENDFEDAIAVVNGLINLFLEKLYQLPSNHAVRIYYILIGHLETHYIYPKVFENIVQVRYTIINWMLKIRANSCYQIGYPTPRLISDQFKFTHYISIDGDHHHHYHQYHQQSVTPSTQDIPPNDERSLDGYGLSNVTTLSFRRGWDIIVKCLNMDKDWPMVQLVLRELPKIMQNKTLIRGNDIDGLGNALVSLFKGNYTKEKFIEHFTTSNEQKDFRALMIPAVASLITYNTLSIPTKKKIVEVLKSELRIDGNLSICLQAFTILLIEKCEIFERQLGDIILTLTKVSDTVNVAIPILEFLSTLAHLPYPTNLSQKQFSYVFVTCLPYTSPARYDHYTVSLAHHIIATWFLKSRIMWRKIFADYIIEGIAKNIEKSIRDAKVQQAHAIPDQDVKELRNEDSSLRKRSSSLTEQSSRRREVNNPQVLKMKQKMQSLQQATINNFDMDAFHIELIETCIDFMARNTFSQSSALPRRLPAADFLLRGGGQTKTWVVGHNIVTITTSACMGNHDWKSCACYCSDWAEITIRKPSSMVSWIMKFENQIGTFANDFSFHDLTALFSDKEIDPGNSNGILIRKRNEESDNSLVDELPLEKSIENITVQEDIKENIIPLQFTASDSSVGSYMTQPINIPSKQETEEGNIAGDDEISYDGEECDDPKRNPVRRVNSSPEMRSNWKINLNNKSSKESKSGSSSNDTVSDDHEETTKPVELEIQQKKKSSYSKETKVSCEAIPEEVITSGQKEDGNEKSLTTRPVQLLSSISAQETPNVASVPKKQHSADDTFQLRRSESNTSQAGQVKNNEWGSVASSNLPLSPRYGKHALVTRQVSHQAQVENDEMGIRARSKTISVIGGNKEAYMKHGNNSDFSVSTSSFDQSQQSTLATSGISPSFVFVQLFSSGKINSSEIIPVTEKHMVTLNLLDFIPPYEIHKIGVLYVTQGQANNEAEILRNRSGSTRYIQFLHNLGSLIAIKDAKEEKLFVNMEAPREGNFTYVWHDDIIQMTFHVATLMPTLESDPNCHEKKKYIGNDYVTIVYNDSGEDYALNTIKGQFNYACVIVQPLELGTNLVSVRAKGDIEDFFKHLEPMIISDRGAPLLARQLALHANMASLVSTSLKNRSVSPYANNWLERLRKIKHLKSKLINETKQDNQQPTLNNTSNTLNFLKDVFTKYS
ncbi:CLUMA_CG006605, isoform A [Clunio marinus]|uniref:CLUMA_CG006605, isoform A n=1 Tax=Clunio marinus TaxID=568069 RepID=A0A1J1HYH3_9DIPT|nr:CLUMA_CG006605, isoform A [Clunio marinus]